MRSYLLDCPQATSYYISINTRAMLDLPTPDKFIELLACSLRLVLQTSPFGPIFQIMCERQPKQ